MSYSIQLLLDRESREYVRKVWETLKLEGISSYMADSAYEPHLNLLGMENCDMEKLQQALRNDLDISRCKQLKCDAAHIGIFPYHDSAVFLGVTMNERLLWLHQCLHNLSTKWTQTSTQHYVPNHWVPHITLACHLTEQKAYEAFLYLTSFKMPFHGMFSELVVVDVPSGNIELNIQL